MGIKEKSFVAYQGFWNPNQIGLGFGVETGLGSLFGLQGYRRFGLPHKIKLIMRHTEPKRMANIMTAPASNISRAVFVSVAQTKETGAGRPTSRGI